MQVVAGKGDHLLEGHLLLLGEGRLREIEKWKNNSNFYTYQADAAGEVVVGLGGCEGGGDEGRDEEGELHPEFLGGLFVGLLWLLWVLEE